MKPEKKRKICVVTGTRAEYGLLYWLMHDISKDPDLVLQTIVTGSHLSSIHGSNYKTIEADDFKIDFKVDMQIGDDSPYGITRSLGIGTTGFADAYRSLQPDIVVVLGDRYEILAAAQAAMIARIPIAHIQGGEITQGAIDEAIRHAITKMAHFHFTTAKENTKRVLQLGEDPEKVFTLGAPGVDNIARLPVLNRKEVEKEVGMELGSPSFLVTYHPVTLSQASPAGPTGELLSALDEFPEAKIIFTKPNADTQNSVIAKMIDDYVAKNPKRSVAHTSLGQLRYINLLRQVDVVIGNSSSAILEAPSLKRAAVNIGDRQKGRLAPPSVLHCGERKEEITTAIRKALSKEFRASVDKMVSPYHCEDVSGKTKQILKTVPLDGVLMKKFHEVKA